MRIVLTLVLFVFFVIASGCGQKGPLFLPQQQAQPQTPAPPPPALPEDTADEEETQ